VLESQLKDQVGTTVTVAGDCKDYWSDEVGLERIESWRGEQKQQESRVDKFEKFAS